MATALELAAVLALAAACTSTTSGAPSAVPSSSATPLATVSSDSAAPSPDSPAPSSDSPAPSGTPTDLTSSARPTQTGTETETDGADGTTGLPGIGDPYYPEAGNGGYQVVGYDLDLRYDPATNRLDGSASISAEVLSEDGLEQFNLDLQPNLRVSAVTIDGAAAEFSQDGSELVITAPKAVAAGASMAVTVDYAGQPELIDGGTIGTFGGGWYRTQSGGAFALGQPFSAAAWYPVNDHPADPATFAVTATVPEKWQVISNGLQETDGLPEPPDGWAVYRWSLDEPVASYLTTIYIETFTIVRDELDDGTPIISALGPSASQNPPPVEDTKRVLEVLADLFGPYPFDASGGVYTGESIGFALETATRPTYGEADIRLIVHELAHQWFGDAVTIGRWSDICLNECFASYAEWLWREDVNRANLDRDWRSVMTQVVGVPAYWSSPLVDMGSGNEFTRVYDRGPMALHALRNEMGDDAFFALLKAWTSTYDGQVVRFDDFTALASTIAGRDLEPFIDAWFYTETVPPEEFRFPGDLG